MERVFVPFITLLLVSTQQQKGVKSLVLCPGRHTLRIKHHGSTVNCFLLSAVSFIIGRRTHH